MVDLELLGSYTLRLGVATLLGIGIGTERESEGHSAGPRTYALVALGAALYTIAGDSYGGDQSRIAAQIVTGIGFLGAGTILRKGDSVHGLTTAASLWAAAGMGLACGRGGLWLWLAAITFAITLLLLGIGKAVERRFLGANRVRELSFEASNDASLGKAVEVAQDCGAVVQRMNRTRLSHDDYIVEMRLRFASDNDEVKVMDRLGALEGVWKVSIGSRRPSGDQSP